MQYGIFFLFEKIQQILTALTTGIHLPLPFCHTTTLTYHWGDLLCQITQNLRDQTVNCRATVMASDWEFPDIIPHRA